MRTSEAMRINIAAECGEAASDVRTPNTRRTIVPAAYGALACAVFAAFVFLRPAAAAEPHASVPCLGDEQSKSVSDAKAGLERDPSLLEPRLRFADALIDQGCYKEAVPVLETGQALFPRSSELQSRLRAARSMLSEEHFFEGLGNAQEAAKLQRNLLRCTKVADVGACDEALRSKPGDPQLTVAKGDALLQGGHPAESLLVYRRAAELVPGDEGIKAKLATAESERETLVSRCEGGAGTAAVDACEAALLHGATDEFTLLRRKGIVLQSMDRPAPALDSFIAANILQQGDKSVALAIVALTDSTGRKDALALAARGSALLTLGRVTESLSALNQAQTLAPGLPGIKSQLALAEKQARAEAKRQPSAQTAKANPFRTTTPTPNEAAGAGGASSRGPGSSAASSGSARSGVPGAVAAGSRTANSGAGRPTAQGPEPTRVAAADSRTYSNDAIAGRTN
jgi:tetratricopeptide (TPR) repeat protein